MKPQDPNPVLTELRAIRRNTGCLVLAVAVAFAPIGLALLLVLYLMQGAGSY